MPAAPSTHSLEPQSRAGSLNTRALQLTAEPTQTPNALQPRGLTAPVSLASQPRLQNHDDAQGAAGGPELPSEPLTRPGTHLLTVGSPPQTDSSQTTVRPLLRAELRGMGPVAAPLPLHSCRLPSGTASPLPAPQGSASCALLGPQ